MSAQFFASTKYVLVTFFSESSLNMDTRAELFKAGLR